MTNEDPKIDKEIQDFVDDIHASVAASAATLDARLRARRTNKEPSARQPADLTAPTVTPDEDTERWDTRSLLEFVRRFRSLFGRSKDTYEARRHQSLVEFATALTHAGFGRSTEDGILLSLNGIEFNERFRAEYHEWYSISDKTLERDRARCTPRIRVRMGRPPQHD